MITLSFYVMSFFGMETRSHRHSLSQFGFSVHATTFHLIDLRHKGKHIESILLVKNRDFRLYNEL
jgi:hypothetical protein